MTIIPTPAVLKSAVTTNAPNRRVMLIGIVAVPFAASAMPAIAAADSGWQRVIHEWEAAAANTAALPDDCPEALFDAVTSIHCEKLRAVSEYPVTTLPMLREKMDLLVKEYGMDDMGGGDEFEHIYADVKRLTGEA